MKCPDCGGKLKVRASGSGRYDTDEYCIKVMYCEGCGKEFSAELRITGRWECNFSEIFHLKN